MREEHLVGSVAIDLHGSIMVIGTLVTRRFRTRRRSGERAGRFKGIPGLVGRPLYATMTVQDPRLDEASKSIAFSATKYKTKSMKTRPFSRSTAATRLPDLGSDASCLSQRRGGRWKVVSDDIKPN
ncbi:MAG: hypothetical protein M3Z15_10925 [Pseudomonadota bacterium]|nr:hypothetical protein [Pseudomonadota bacterium]